MSIIKNKTLTLWILFTTVSCTTTPNYDLKDYYPPDINQTCLIEKSKAKQIIEQVDKSPLEIKMGCTVTKVVGTKKGNNGWGWIDPAYPNMYVCGLCGKNSKGVYIKIGANPAGGDINLGALQHEFAHYWLISNKNDYSHDLKYKRFFSSWNDVLIKFYNITNTTEAIDYMEELN